jgi:antitoxin PrlF
MSTFSGKITTTGKSEAIRLEKALFRSHPEFRQKAKVRAHVIGPGTMLLSVAVKQRRKAEPDPVVRAFLSFLAADISRRPHRVKPLAKTRIKEGRELTKRTKVDDKESLPDDVTL